MSNDVQVAGVGMIPFTKPGRSAITPKWERTPHARHSRMRELTTAWSSRPTSAMCTATRPPARQRCTGWADRHPDRQRQQQLLHRLDRAVPGPPGGGQRRRRLRAGARLRADGARGAGRGVQRPTRAPSRGSTKLRDELQGTDADVADGGAVLRRRRPRPYATQYGTSWRRSRRSRRRRAGTPRTIRRRCSAIVVTDEDVLASPVIYGPLTRLQCCPPTCGAAAAIVCSRRVRPQASG